VVLFDAAEVRRIVATNTIWIGSNTCLEILSNIAILEISKSSCICMAVEHWSTDFMPCETSMCWQADP
jgi:hypothetical protein